MKKLMILGLSSVFALGANAQSLEERVEALEFESYENFFKMSGQLEMRYDVMGRENKDAFEQANNDESSDYITQVATNAGLQSALAAYGTTITDAMQAAYDAADCGGNVDLSGVVTALNALPASAGAAGVAGIQGTVGTDNAYTKGGCTAVGADQTDRNSFGRLFLKLDMESTPSDRMTFYGRISMAKFMGTAYEVNSGEEPGDNFYDLRSGNVPNTAQAWIERAFVNYNITKKDVLTFGRLPTVLGPPTNMRTNQPWLGNYPLAAFSGEFDGMAYTHAFEGGHAFKAIWAPLQTVNFRQPVVGDPNEGSDNRADTWTWIYEVEKKVSWARKVHAIVMHTKFQDLNGAGSDLTADFTRNTIYAELIGLGGTRFDFAFSYQHSLVKSKNNVAGFGGWLAGPDDGTDSETDGAGYGFLLRYGITSKIKIGAEWYHNEKDTWAVDSANNEAVSFYNNLGTGQRIFYSQELAGGLKFQTEYSLMQTDYYRGPSNILGGLTEVDQQWDVWTTRLIAQF